MQAVVISEPGAPSVLTMVEVPDISPGQGELLIKVAAAGVNRADLLQRQGHYAPPLGASGLLGLEVSGTIAEVGDEVTGWSVGDPCVALLAGGGYAEYAAVQAVQVVPPPAGVDLISAAGLIEVAATVWSNLATAHLAAGETFLVHGGSGGIGSFAIQYAKSLGARVIATAGSTDKITYCESIGVDHALSYRDDWVAATQALGGVDVVLDNMGAKYLQSHLGLLRPEGRLVIIGLQGGRQAEIDLSTMMGKRAHLVCTTLRARPTEQKAKICAAVAEQVWPMIMNGAIRPAPETRIPLAAAAQAHELLESGNNLGKIILVL